jgi:serine/threonine protein kinase
LAVQVWQVRHKASDQILAMKVFRKDFLVESKAVSSTFVERDVLKKCSHPNIVKLHYAFQDADRLYLVMDYINGGQLFNVLRDGDSVADEKLARFYLAELVLALEYLHDNNIVHRDLKPENILIDEDGHVLLTDFGLAKEHISNENRTSSFCGTLEYMSPEMIQGQPYSFSADMWSMGILLYGM